MKTRDKIVGKIRGSKGEKLQNFVRNRSNWVKTVLNTGLSKVEFGFVSNKQKIKNFAGRIRGVYILNIPATSRVQVNNAMADDLNFAPSQLDHWERNARTGRFLTLDDFKMDRARYRAGFEEDPSTSKSDHPSSPRSLIENQSMYSSLKNFQFKNGHKKKEVEFVLGFIERQGMEKVRFLFSNSNSNQDRWLELRTTLPPFGQVLVRIKNLNWFAIFEKMAGRLGVDDSFNEVNLGIMQDRRLHFLIDRQTKLFNLGRIAALRFGNKSDLRYLHEILSNQTYYFESGKESAKFLNPIPEFRLNEAILKRKASRWNKHLTSECLEINIFCSESDFSVSTATNWFKETCSN